MDQITKIRKEIDEIDRKIVRLLAERIKASKKIGRLKKNTGIKIKQSKRELEIMKNIGKEAEKHKLKKGITKKIFSVIFKISRANQQRSRRKKT